MGLEWNIEGHDEVSSTQDIVIALANDGGSEGMCVKARMQSEGRGRHGREWLSQEGNLFCSFLLRPHCSAQDVGQLSLIAGLSLIQAIEALGAHTTPILKWPNDVLIEQCKCAGILLETAITNDGNVDWVVLGLGVNIVSAPEGIGYSLTQCVEGDIDADMMLNAFLEAMGRNYAQWQVSGFEQLRQDWLSRAHSKGDALSVKIGEHLVKGMFHDIDANGNLRLEQPDGNLRTIAAGEVYLY